MRRDKVDERGILGKLIRSCVTRFEGKQSVVKQLQSNVGQKTDIYQSLCNVKDQLSDPLS